MRIVITGATGNVGSALVRRLRTEDWVSSLVTVSRRGMPLSPLREGGLSHWELDLGHPGTTDVLTRRLEGVDAVVHLAWLIQPSHDQEALHRTNVDGAKHLLQAAAAAGVPHVVVVSSVGAYSPGPKDRRVDESWATQGVASSSYSRDKAEVERLLDAFEPQLGTLSRIRPGLVFQRLAGAEITRYFLGPLVPVSLLGRLRLPVLPLPRELVFQAVHADDLAAAIALVLQHRAGGPFNVAGEPELTPDDLARSLGAGRAVPLPLAALRLLAALTWRAHLQPTEPGWLDLAANVPLMSTERIRELGWRPGHSSTAALAELVGAMSAGTGAASPPLQA